MRKLFLVGVVLICGAVHAQGTVDTAPWIARGLQGQLGFRRFFDAPPRGYRRPDWRIEFVDPRALDLDNRRYIVASSNALRGWDVQYDPNNPDSCSVKVADNARLTRPKTYQFYIVTIKINDQRKFGESWFRVFQHIDPSFKEA